MKTITWLSPQDPPEWFPPLEQALDEPAGLAGGRRRSVAGAAARRLSARHLSLVFARAAGALVVAGPARGAVPRGVPLLAQPRARPFAMAASTAPSTGTFAAVIEACAAPRARSAGHLDHRRDARGLLRAAPAAATRTASRPSATRELVGGLYGVRLGGVFFGESMFSLERDASKVALAHLVGDLRAARHRADRLPAALAAPARASAAAAIPRAHFQQLLSATHQAERARPASPPNCFGWGPLCRIRGP